MPDSNQILNEIRAAGSTSDVIRRRYLEKLHQLTNRNIVIYYSGWLQKQQIKGSPISITDADISGFMTVSHQLDRTKGLDLILHTPGGELGAAEALVNYLRSMYNTDIRAFVPQLAMSAGTMIACACKEIYMGKHSNLGPIDPQFNGIPAHGALADFERALKEIQQDKNKILVWQPILTKYHPGFLDQCYKSIELTKEIVDGWLRTGMFRASSLDTAKKKSKKVVDELANYKKLKSHARHFPPETCKKIGLTIHLLEDNPDLQDAVLSVHHACVHTFSATSAVKIIENHIGRAHIDSIQQVPIPR